MKKHKQQWENVEYAKVERVLDYRQQISARLIHTAIKRLSIQLVLARNRHAWCSEKKNAKRLASVQTQLKSATIRRRAAARRQLMVSNRRGRNSRLRLYLLYKPYNWWKSTPTAPPDNRKAPSSLCLHQQHYAAAAEIVLLFGITTLILKMEAHRYVLS